jgi:hypothetical protein
MYDVGFRMKQMKLPKSIRDQMPEYHPKAFYVKVENNVKKADRYLKMRNLSLKNYCSDEMQKRLKVDLIETYNSIQKKATFILQDASEKPDVKQLLYLILLEKNPNIRKVLEAKMKALNLDRDSIKARQKTIRSDLKKFEPIPDPCIDQMPLIQESIKA